MDARASTIGEVGHASGQASEAEAEHVEELANGPPSLSSSEGASSSSDTGSDVFEEPVQTRRVLKPPEAPPGTILVQHAVNKTIHLLPDSGTARFLCGRTRGPNHGDPVALRWDTPKCWTCFKAKL